MQMGKKSPIKITSPFKKKKAAKLSKSREKEEMQKFKDSERKLLDLSPTKIGKINMFSKLGNALKD